jgi:pimeloyl-ACP methyl ester carboxylesterase
MNLKHVNGVLKGAEKPITYDYRYLTDFNKPLVPVVFMHGFKGYKDWGAFNLVADKFVENGFFVLKFNFSFNGTTPDKPTAFVDLEAFKNNNFSRELSDLDNVINYLAKLSLDVELDMSQLTLLAHSRGGATAFIYAATHSIIKCLVTWASVGNIKTRIAYLNHNEFKRTGVIYLPNARTQQQMPIGFQFVQDYEQNEDIFDLHKCAKGLSIPTLMIHGTNDLTVSTMEGEELASANDRITFEKIENGDHTFSTQEPWTDRILPAKMSEVVEKTILFLKDQS